jgi:hypothetical protein
MRLVLKRLPVAVAEWDYPLIQLTIEVIEPEFKISELVSAGYATLNFTSTPIRRQWVLKPHLMDIL